MPDWPLLTISTLPALTAARSGRFPAMPETATFRHFQPFRDIQAALAYTSDRTGPDHQILASWLARITPDPGPRCPDPGSGWPGSGVRSARIQGPRASQEALGRAKSAISGPWALEAQGPGALDPIQHLPRIDCG